jgi:integrase
LLSVKAPLLRDFAPRFLYWVDHSQLELNSKKYYKSGWKTLEQSPLPAMRLDHISTDIAERCRFEGSAANGNQAFRTLSRMMSKAVEWKILKQAPTIKLLKQQGRQELIDAETEKAMLDTAAQPLKDVLTIILDTGMRPSEVFRIKIENVIGNDIRIPKGKTENSRRLVPMSDRVEKLVQARIGERKKGWLFTSKRGKDKRLTTVAKQFRSLRETLGLPASFVLYCARHTFATDILAATGNVAAVMKTMGHSDVRMMMHYQHPGLEQVRAAVNSRNKDTHKTTHTEDLTFAAGAD